MQPKKLCIVATPFYYIQPNEIHVIVIVAFQLYASSTTLYLQLRPTKQPLRRKMSTQLEGYKM